MNMPDWKHYDSPYWSPVSDENYNLVLNYVGEEQRSYDDGKTEKWVMIFDVLKVGEKEFNPPKQFVTGAAGFASQIRPLMEASKEPFLNVFLSYRQKHKEYNIIPAIAVSTAMRKKDA